MPAYGFDTASRRLTVQVEVTGHRVLPLLEI